MTGEISGIIKKNKGLCTLLHQQQGCIASDSCILVDAPILTSAVNIVLSAPRSRACVAPLARGHRRPRRQAPSAARGARAGRLKGTAGTARCLGGGLQPAVGGPASETRTPWV